MDCTYTCRPESVPWLGSVLQVILAVGSMLKQNVHNIIFNHR